uniref:TAFA chemokine like family member 5 n=1 Tax=Cyprinus carpio carpio TaxID=630221 RepID=A0A9J7Z8C0_CYPCA
MAPAVRSIKRKDAINWPRMSTTFWAVLLLTALLIVYCGQLAAGTCEIVTLDRDSSQPRRTIARQTARCACKKGQIAGTTRARPACVDESVSMSGRISAKLLVIVSQDDSRKLLLPDGIPESVDEFIEKVREAFGLNGRFSLQYQDKDFGDVFVNLTNPGELQSLGTLKIISLPDKDSFTAQTNGGTQSDDALSSVGSGDTDDTIILSSPGSETVSTRNQQWPKEL